MSYFIVRLQARGDKDKNFLYASSSGKLTTEKRYAYHFNRLDNAQMVAKVYGGTRGQFKYHAEVLHYEA